MKPVQRTHRPRCTTRWAAWTLACCIGSWCFALPQWPASAQTDTAAEFDRALAAWDLDAARQLANALPAGPRRSAREGMIAIHEGDYAMAERRLAQALTSPAITQDANEKARVEQYLGLARGSQRALGPAIQLRSPDGATEAVFADAKDALLARYLFDAMATARSVFASEFGVTPDHAVRFEFLDDPAKLAMVTPLTLENIRTTGTVGITKHRRIVMITPRVMVFGYGWIDTAVHEYVHYLLTLRTRNNAPVWLQEGLAKLFETRWRRTAPPELDPAVAEILHRAISRDELVTFEQMYPSLAMLPTQEMAALAYAEAETMLALLIERRGRPALAALLDAVADGKDARTAFEAAWGGSFDAFLAQWKKTMLARTAGKGGGELDRIEFKEGRDAQAELLEDVFSHLGGGKARQHARLGVLLQIRGHRAAAASQYEKARNADPRARKDPTLARRLGELYVQLDEFRRAIPLLSLAANDDQENANVAAAEARARLRSGDHEGARRALDRAVRNNPFIPSIHCDLAELATDATARASERELCGHP